VHNGNIFPPIEISHLTSDAHEPILDVDSHENALRRAP
jgi:hypothetical protein